MFGIDFFPTPPEVIEQMLEHSDTNDKVCLEPSAGSGNIVDALMARGANRVMACEIDPNLRKILSGKCDIICHDFMELRSEQVSHINMIVMNPPFSKQEQHILHAWEIAPPGCEIITLCNSSLLKKYSPNRTEQQIIEIIEQNGTSWDMGQCFDQAERKTDVFVGCIRVFKKGEPGMEFDGYFDMDNDDIIDQHEEGIQSYNYVRDVVSRYVAIVKNWDHVTEVQNQMNDMMSFFPFSITFKPHVESYGDSTTVTKEVFQKRLQMCAWRMIFNKCNVDKYITNGVQKDLNRFIEMQQHVPFTVKNVYKMIQVLVGTYSQRMDKVIIEAFETIMQYSEMNLETFEKKWKTNTNFMMNKKFIIPYMCDYDKRWPTLCETTKVSYNGCNKLDDISKGLCYITGIPYEKIGSIDRFLSQRRIPWGEEFKCGFFSCRGHKSGTMHFKFIDDDLLLLFNKRYAELKGWTLSNEKPKRSNSRAKEKEGTAVYNPKPNLVNNEYQLF